MTIPFWSATQGSYSYQIVGQNTMVRQTIQTTTIPTLIVPLVITIPNGRAGFFDVGQPEMLAPPALRRP